MGLIVEERHTPETESTEVPQEYTPYKPAKGYGWGEALPEKQGLYDPSLEKDACGVGFAAHIKGKASHKIVSDGEYTSLPTTKVPKMTDSLSSKSTL